MRFITSVSIRSASCLGAVALAGASWFGASPAQADEATPSPVPSTSEAPAPSSTPVPSAPVPTPEPSDSDVPVPPVTVTVPPSQVPSDLPMPPTETEPTVVVVVTEKPADLLLPATNNGRRPTALPHTGDVSDGVSPYGIGAGICAIAFAGSFVGRRKK